LLQCAHAADWEVAMPILSANDGFATQSKFSSQPPKQSH
jgi:hypothetical protein